MDTSSQNSILEFLRENISNIHFKTLRENEREPSEKEKLLSMQQTLSCDPGLFLSKWGKYLPKEHLDKFDPLRGDYEVDWHLNHFEQQKQSIMETLQGLNPSQRKDKRILNRRFRFLLSNLEKTAYFSDEAMEMREPLLFDDYIGQYIEEEQRQPPSSLVESILHNIDRDVIYQKLQQQKRIREEQFEEEEESDEEIQSMEDSHIAVEAKPTVQDGLQSSSNESNTAIDQLSPNESSVETMPRIENLSISQEETITESEISFVENMAILSISDQKQRQPLSPAISDEKKPTLEEQVRLREEFIRLMREKFITGNDPEFDYDQVDFNEEYDNIDQENNDIQDNYFDDEEPNDITYSKTGIIDY